MNTGLLIMRLVVGLLLAGHGAQKLFGWFDGHGLAGTAGMLSSLGYRPGRVFAVVTGLVELVAGALLAVGFLVPLGAAMVVGQMLNAGWTVHRSSGVWNTNGGYEYPLVLAAVATGLAFTSAGEFSLDELFDLDFTTDWWGIAAVGFGLLVGVLTLNIRRPIPLTVPPAERERVST